jgi:hypothetical protein
MPPEDILLEYLRVLPLPSSVQTYKMTTLGKLVFASLLTSMATGNKSPFKLSGDPRKLDVLSKVVQSSKRFQDEIKRPGATVDSVVRAMDIKNMDAGVFRSVFGATWPL